MLFPSFYSVISCFLGPAFTAWDCGVWLWGMFSPVGWKLETLGLVQNKNWLPNHCHYSLSSCVSPTWRKSVFNAFQSDVSLMSSFGRNDHDKQIVPTICRSTERNSAALSAVTYNPNWADIISRGALSSAWGFVFLKQKVNDFPADIWRQRHSLARPCRWLQKDLRGSLLDTPSPMNAGSFIEEMRSIPCLLGLAGQPELWLFTLQERPKFLDLMKDFHWAPCVFSCLMSKGELRIISRRNRYFGVARRRAASLKNTSARAPNLLCSAFLPQRYDNSRRQHPQPAKRSWHVVIPPGTAGKLIFHRSRGGNDRQTNKFFCSLFIGTTVSRLQLWLSAAARTASYLSWDKNLVLVNLLPSRKSSS